ncbi:oxidoreductase [Amycolatopsis mediterranei S699]|uniref:Oxidoreductase n=2 Tax=Amycolatopsis mediterranei TaxID=33910 RepID=A0A9R0U628_AMYMS|nr:Gfo/Idh/MocA family oxidoreductase [Amycolatopsis mediterranei]ADJ42462.1 putative oxidoreductase [Amycolatopsis mediterranei U32]AEK39148.1 oxidoreductase [Amycolatopsis mediterranei S699]AFO74176.1 oxidoreductase [Amycolatopsis mediterranei S699]AGT81305.1 oxidoreductase [Amycolatopsis mediterranei RB]KDO09630.1 oxidoreductase [Amycolatopsis mediterranei]
MAPLRIGIMGCASIAVRKVLPAMAASPRTEITAIASRNPGKAAEIAHAYGCRAVEGYSALLDLDEVEAVYIPLPNAAHAGWIELALTAGKHVLAEKPLTTSVSRTCELIAAAGAAGLVLMENVMFLHHSQHTAVRDLLAGGAIGELRAFHAAFAVPARPAGDIRHRAELGGGALLDTGVYPVRAAMSFLGSEVDVVSAVLTRRHGRPVDSAGQALLCTADGVSASATFGIDHAYRSGYELWGSEGRIVLDHAFTPPADHLPVVRLERRSGVDEIPLPPDDQVANTLTAFAAAVRSGRLPDNDDVARQAVLVDDIRTKARLYVDHAPEPVG